MNILGGVMAACCLALIIAVLAWPRTSAEPASSPISDAAVFIVGSGALYTETKADAQIYLDLLDRTGSVAQALDGAGGLPDAVAADSIKQLFELQAGQP